jgi:hypothetical protein
MKRSNVMEKRGVFGASAFAVVLSLLLLPAVAHANNVAVNCPGQSLNAAVAALPPGPNTITVTGTCNENVSLSNQRSLTIVAGAGGAKIVQPQDTDTFDISLSQDVHLQKLEIVGVPGSPLGAGGAGVSIFEASDVHIEGCDIHDNEGSGVSADRNSVVFLSNSSLHNNPLSGDGLDVFDNSTADVRGTTIQNNGGPGSGVGVVVSRNSVALFHQTNLIQNNADFGIVVRLLSTVLFAGTNGTGTTIQGHNIGGINVNEGGHLQANGPVLIQGNGIACPPETFCGGIFASENATVELFGFGTVTDNHGDGISELQGANVHLRGGATISNNTADGLNVRRISILQLDPGNSITGNGGASIACDSRSLVIGNVAGLSKVRCGEIVAH